MKRLLTALILLLLSPRGWTEEKTVPALSRFSVANMDRGVEPGADFYRFACGGWLKAHEIPADQVTWSPSAELIHRNAFLLREILEKASEPRADREVVTREVGDFYAAAMDVEKIEKLVFEPIRGDLAKIDALASIADLAPLLAEFHTRDVDALFSVWVSADERASDVYALQLGQGGLGLPDRDYYFAKSFAKDLAGYREHIAKMLGLLGEDAATIAADVKAVLAIETALAKASKRREELEDPIANYHKLTLSELKATAPAFDWAKYFEVSHAAKFDAALVGQPEFFKAMSALLASQPLAEWKSYLRWHVLTDAAPLLHRAAEEENFHFYRKQLGGQQQLDPRWKRATHRTDGALGEALGKLYVEQHFPAAARDRMREMVANITAVYRDRLGKVPWMTPATRALAVEKFSRFSAKLGAPGKFRDYSSIELKRDDHFGNVQRAAEFESRRQMARIGQPIDRTEWGMTPPTVNAYFEPTKNEIVFPAGILQPPFFDAEMDDAVNYGATGATIGHEMTHGYDSEGRKYDASGNLRDWWTKADVKQFNTRAAKLVAQFNEYSPLPGLHVNGKLTLAENIADLGGLSIAFEALERALAADPAKRKKIDGFTPEQRFFLSYAQSWAAKYRDEYLRQSLTTDSHSPEMLRGFAPLLDMQEFYAAFAIKRGAKMWREPAKRAVIW